MADDRPGAQAVPFRYRNYFRYLRVNYDDLTYEMKWECRMCGQILKRNTAGAQSHLAKHVREGRDASFHLKEPA